MFKYEDVIGLPFQDGGRGNPGYDCWGLTKELFRRQGIRLREYTCSSEDTAAVAGYMEDLKQYWHRLEEPCTGCLVAVRMLDTGWVNHCGVYLGHGRFIHAYCEETGVVVDRIRRWGPRIIGYYWPTGAAYEI